jgi:hypothetical protein
LSLTLKAEVSTTNGTCPSAVPYLSGTIASLLYVALTGFNDIPLHTPFTYSLFGFCLAYVEHLTPCFTLTPIHPLSSVESNNLIAIDGGPTATNDGSVGGHHLTSRWSYAFLFPSSANNKIRRTARHYPCKRNGRVRLCDRRCCGSG